MLTSLCLPKSLRDRGLTVWGKHEFIGAHASAGASHLSFANVPDHELTEAFILKQARCGLREEDLPALGGVAKLLAAEDRKAEETDSCFAGMHSHADRGTQTVGP